VRRALLLVALALAGCRGDAGGVVWKDAKGVIVSGVAPSFAIHVSGESALYVFDGNGHLWRVEPDDLKLSVASQYDASRAWDGPDCTGTEVIWDPVPLPRVTFRAGGDEAIRVRTDGAVQQTIHAVSVDRGSGCIPADDDITGIAGTLPETAIEPPLLGYTAPLHAEPR
jgi:hypothetical protein